MTTFFRVLTGRFSDVFFKFLYGGGLTPVDLVKRSVKPVLFLDSFPVSSKFYDEITHFKTMQSTKKNRSFGIVKATGIDSDYINVFSYLRYETPGAIRKSIMQQRLVHYGNRYSAKTNQLPVNYYNYDAVQKLNELVDEGNDLFLKHSFTMEEVNDFVDRASFLIYGSKVDS